MHKRTPGKLDLHDLANPAAWQWLIISWQHHEIKAVSFFSCKSWKCNSFGVCRGRFISLSLSVVPDCFYLLTEIMFVRGKLHFYLTRKNTPHHIKTIHWDCFIGFMPTAVQSQSRSAKSIYLTVYLQHSLHHSPCPCPGSCFPPNEQSL